MIINSNIFQTSEVSQTPMISFQDITDVSDSKNNMSIHDYANYSSLIDSNKILQHNSSK